MVLAPEERQRRGRGRAARQGRPADRPHGVERQQRGPAPALGDPGLRRRQGAVGRRVPGGPEPVHQPAGSTTRTSTSATSRSRGLPRRPANVVPVLATPQQPLRDDRRRRLLLGPRPERPGEPELHRAFQAPRRDGLAAKRTLAAVQSRLELRLVVVHLVRHRDAHDHGHLDARARAQRSHRRDGADRRARRSESRPYNRAPEPITVSITRPLRAPATSSRAGRRLARAGRPRLGHRALSVRVEGGRTDRALADERGQGRHAPASHRDRRDRS